MRFLLWGLLLVGLFSGLRLRAEDARRVSVGDHRLFLDCRGTQKGPTVILLAGAGGGSDTTETWEKVQSGVAGFAKVCSYDRMGVGQSDHLARTQSEAEIIEDLHQLLMKAKVPGPYILVGHSMGGVYARKYAETYPREVAGFVFVDSADEEQVWRFAKISPTLVLEYPEYPNWSKLEEQGWLMPGRLLQWRTGAPVIVLEHGVMWPRGMFQGMTEGQYQSVIDTWHAMQVDLSERSKRGEWRRAPESGHYIQTQQPELVVAAIHDVLKMTRRAR